MRNLYSIVSLALVGAMAFATASQAQTAAAPIAIPIALVDANLVIVNSSAGKAVQTQLDVELRKFRDTMTKLEDELKSGGNDLARQRAILQPDAYNEQVQALQRKQASGQQYAQDRQDAINKAKNDALQVVVDNMKDVVQQIAIERKIGLVLSKQAVLNFADKNIDITDDVIQRLNTKLPSVTVTVPAAGAAPAVAAPAAAPKAAAPAKKVILAKTKNGEIIVRA